MLVDMQELWKPTLLGKAERKYRNFKGWLVESLDLKEHAKAKIRLTIGALAVGAGSLIMGYPHAKHPEVSTTPIVETTTTTQDPCVITVVREISLDPSRAADLEILMYDCHNDIPVLDSLQAKQISSPQN
jgi:hypothetical protein